MHEQQKQWYQKPEILIALLMLVAAFFVGIIALVSGTTEKKNESSKQEKPVLQKSNPLAEEAIFAGWEWHPEHEPEILKAISREKTSGKVELLSRNTNFVIDAQTRKPNTALGKTRYQIAFAIGGGEPIGNNAFAFYSVKDSHYADRQWQERLPPEREKNFSPKNIQILILQFDTHKRQDEGLAKVLSWAVKK